MVIKSRNLIPRLFYILFSYQKIRSVLKEQYDSNFLLDKWNQSVNLTIKGYYQTLIELVFLLGKSR